MAPEPAPSRIPLDAPESPNTDGELISASGRNGPLPAAVIEHLRVQAAACAAWLEAEQTSRERWHAIPHAQIEALHEPVERIAPAAPVRPGVLPPLPGSPAANSFPLVHAGELPAPVC